MARLKPLWDQITLRLLESPPSAWVAGLSAVLSREQKLKKFDDAAFECPQPSLAAILQNPQLSAPLAGVAAALVLSYLSYRTMLRPVGDPEDIHRNLGTLLWRTTIAAALYVLAMGLYRRFLRTCATVWPRLFATGSIAQQLTTAALQFLPALYPLILAMVDFGSSKERHGAYNLVLFGCLTLPIFGLEVATREVLKRVTFTRARVLALLASVVVALGWANVAVAGVRATWYGGVGGSVMASAALGNLLAEQRAALAAAAVTSSGARSMRATGPAAPGTPEQAAAAVSAGTVVGDHAGVCEWGYNDIWVPLYEFTPLRALLRAALNPLAECPARAVPAFSVHLLEEQTAESEEDAAEALLFTSESLAAAARQDRCNPADARLYLPASVRVTCPPDLPFSYVVPADARTFESESKHGEGNLQAVVYTSQQPVQGPPRSRDGVTTIRLSARRYGEALVVHCGDDTEYLAIPRPSRATLIRLHRWWGPGAVSLPLPSGPGASIFSSSASAAAASKRGRRRSSGSASSNDGLPVLAQPPNVLYIVLDAVSRLQARRQLPQTVATLERIARSGASDVVEFFRLHSHGATTGPNTAVMYTGAAEAVPGNEAIWEAAGRTQGYVSGTMYGMCEDWASEYMRFSSQADHQAGALFCSPEAYPLDSPMGIAHGPYSSRRRCMRDRLLHSHVIDYAHRFWATHAGAPKWLTLSFMEGHEGTGEVLPSLDADLAGFLQQLLVTGGAAADTVVVIAADHGLHMGLPYLLTTQGRREHMNPAAWMMVPPLASFPDFSQPMREALYTNAQRLVTHADMHLTMRQVMSLRLPLPAEPGGEPPAPSLLSDPLLSPRCNDDAPDHRRRLDRAHAQYVPPGSAPLGLHLTAPEGWQASLMPGIPLLGPDPVPADRTCTDAGITAERCECRSLQ